MRKDDERVERNWQRRRRMEGEEMKDRSGIMRYWRTKMQGGEGREVRQEERRG